jgi:hypothetical protein
LLNGVVVTQLPTSPKVPRNKMTFGDDGTSRDVSVGFPMPTMAPDTSTSGTISATDIVVAAHGGNGVLLTGTPTALSSVALPLPGGESAWVVQLTGTFGGGTVWFETSANSTNGTDGSWTTLSMRTIGTNTTVIGDSALIAGLFRGNTSSMSYVRVRITGATTPSVAVVLRVSDAPGPVALNAPLPGGANRIGEVSVRAADLTVVVTAAAAAAATLTIPAPAAGLFHYFTGIYLLLYSTAARTGVATPILVTTTNMPGGRAFLFGTAGAIGTVDRLFEDFAMPIRASAAATATTFVAPAVTGGLWRMTATYYTAP